MVAYNLQDKVHKGYIFARLSKRIYELLQAGHIAHDALIQHLELYVWHPTRTTPGLWTRDIRPITFTLVFDDFGVKCSGKQHALHLKRSLEAKYKVTTDWDGKLYVVISITWDYDKVAVQLAMAGYVYTATH